MISLEGKIALVPGASRPVGRAIARKLAEHGSSLILPYHDWPESSQEMIDEFNRKEVDFLALPIDLTDEDQIKQLFHKIRGQFGKLHYLVNNIERGGMPVVHGSYDREHNKEQWDLEMETTLKAKWLLFNSALPLLNMDRNSAVLNISSIAAEVGRSGPAELLFNDGYSAANSGITVFTKTWAREGAPNIRVNELMLGLIRNRHGEGTRGWKALESDDRERILDHILLKRTGYPEEVADMVFFLLCQATYLTGSLIRMDGGYILGGEKTTQMPEGIL